MSAKAGLASSAPWILALVLCAGASAQDSRGDQDNKRGRQAVETETIRGMVAGITAEGELAVDYRNRRAVEAVETLVTVVGAPWRDGKEDAEPAERGQEGGHARHHRHNVYVMVLSPRTQVRDARENGGKEENAKASSLDELELGDRVEVKFTRREEDRSAGAGDQARRAKHGRHRIYFGDAMTITMLPHAHHDAGAQRGGEGAQDKEQK